MPTDANSLALYREGMAMLSALAIDLALCGHDVHTCLDGDKATRTSSILGGSHVHEVDRKNDDESWMDRWIEVALLCDQTIVIAPEIHQKLEYIVDRIRGAGARVLASSGAFLQATSDKLATANLFKQSRVPHPSTQTLSQFLTSIDPDQLQDNDDESVVTLKRRDGAGCVDMKVFDSPRILTEWLTNRTSRSLIGDDWIVQQWLAGRPASMALLVSDSWQLLGAVDQRIALENHPTQTEYSEVSYLGGTGPLAGVCIEQLMSLANQVRDALPSGAAGWIGIDFLVPNEAASSKDLVVIEVNPRLTTSYLGYRKWYGHTLADALLGNTTFTDRKDVLSQQLIEFDLSSL